MWATMHFTNSPAETHKLTVESLRDEAGAPGDCIEITDEMMKAGVRAYRNRDSRFMGDSDIVEEIYAAMSSLVPLPTIARMIGPVDLQFSNRIGK
jgi:hypothetical protein